MIGITLHFLAAPLAFITPLKDVTVNREESVKLMCELNKPDQVVTWLKDGNTLTTAQKKNYRITVDKYKEGGGNKYKLIIQKSELADSGQFSCSVADAKTECTVTVIGLFCAAIDYSCVIVPLPLPTDILCRFSP